MLQPRFWQLLFFGLLSSFVIYSMNFSSTVLPSSSINTHVSLDVAPGKLHVLITHGTGFVGSHIALALLDAGHAVTLLDDHPFSVSHLYKLLADTGSRLKVLSSSLSDAQQLKALLSAAKPAVDAVVHLADLSAEGERGVRHCRNKLASTQGLSLVQQQLNGFATTAVLFKSEPLHLLTNSTSHILSLLEAMDGSSVTTLVVSSSYSVYGQPDAYPVAESAAKQPTTAHGHAALFTEGAVELYAAKKPFFNALLLRHGSVMGTDPHARIGSFIWPSGSTSSDEAADALSSCMSAAVQGLQQQPYQLQVPKHSMQVQGEDVPCFKEYVHVSDLAAGYVATISRASNPPAIYNVGSGRPVTHQEVMNACETVLGVSAQVNQQIPTDGDCYGVAADITAIQSDTSWRPEYQLDDALSHVQHALSRS